MKHGRKINKKKIIILTIIALIFLVLAIVIFTPPKVELKNHEIPYGQKSQEKDFKLTRFGKDYTDKVKVISKVKTDKLGSYEITYKVKIGLIEFTKKEIIKVIDDEKPVITLNGEEKTYVCPNTQYKDEGATAKDNYDGDLTKKIKAKTSKEKVTYIVKDSSNNEAKKIRTLIFDDKEGPTVNLKGNKTEIISVGDNYIDSGATATDNCDGEISTKLVMSGKVDTSKIGTYNITYSAVDSKNNQGSATRVVTVKNKVVANGRAKTIYLTFDDGPSGDMTPKFLDILKSEGVKGTFFVINHDSSTDYLIKRAYNEGHTIGLHSYTHNYSKVYASDTSYFNDLKAIENKVFNLTGYRSKIIRFPGGSSNTVSKHYSTGIMTRLSKEVENRGYINFDWNVTSGDAGGTTDPNQIYKNITSNLTSGASIVLMHDRAGNTGSLNALRRVIQYGKQNGYTFAALTPSTTPYHHHINN